DLNEKLIDRAEDDRRLRAPAVRVAVLVNFLSNQAATFAQMRDNFLVRVKHILARQHRHADLFGKASVVIDRRENGQAILDSSDVIVGAVTGRNMDLASAGFRGHEIGSDDNRIAVEKRMARSQSDEITPLAKVHVV